MIEFCERLKKERKRLGLSQTAFGALVGVTKQSQMLYEKGQRKPDSDYLMAAAHHGVDVNYLIYGVAGGQSDNGEPIDLDFLDYIVERLEALADDSGREWTPRLLMRSAAQVYNFIQEGGGAKTDDDVDRVLKLVVNR